jgi:hypothetical protein
VKAIHTGYSGPATRKDNAALERDATALVQRLPAGDDHSDSGAGEDHKRSGAPRAAAGED